MTSAAATFPGTPDSVPAARRFVRDALAGWGLPDDAVEMLLSEACTNAVLHARTEFTVTVGTVDGPAGDPGPGGALIRVRVADLSPAVPRQRAYGTEATTGRGLRLIDTLARAWGCDRHDGGGKSVWFDVDPAGAAEPAMWDGTEDLDDLLARFDDAPAGT